MKNTTKITGFLLLVLALMMSGAAKADEVQRTLAQKKFDVNKDALLSVEHQFGKVECKNWDEMAISVKVNATVKARNAEQANKIMERIEVEIEGNRNGVSVETDLVKKLFDGDENEVSIDIEIMMPTNVRLEFDHQFGNAFIESATGPSSISSQYGSLEINSLEALANEVEIGFGEARIDYIGGGDLEISYSSADVGEAVQLTIESDYSSVSVEKVESLEIENEGGNVELGDVGVVELSSKFSECKIENLSSMMTAETEYGSLKVRNISADFSEIVVDNSFGSVKLAFESRAAFNLEAELEFCDLSFPENRAQFSQRISEATEKYYKGTFGKGSPNANVNIESSFGNVSIEM